MLLKLEMLLICHKELCGLYKTSQIEKIDCGFCTSKVSSFLYLM
jgi:hypothetical protein